MITMTVIITLAAIFFGLALFYFLKELQAGSDADEITFEKLRDAAGKGQSVTLTPDQCGQLYNRYRRTRHLE
jgi:hypothetical protein